MKTLPSIAPQTLSTQQGWSGPMPPPLERICANKQTPPSTRTSSLASGPVILQAQLGPFDSARSMPHGPPLCCQQLATPQPPQFSRSVLIETGVYLIIPPCVRYLSLTWPACTPAWHGKGTCQHSRDSTHGQLFSRE